MAQHKNNYASGRGGRGGGRGGGMDRGGRGGGRDNVRVESGGGKHNSHCILITEIVSLEVVCIQQSIKQ